MTSNTWPFDANVMRLPANTVVPKANLMISGVCEVITPPWVPVVGKRFSAQTWHGTPVATVVNPAMTPPAELLPLVGAVMVAVSDHKSPRIRAISVSVLASIV
jgi:hypothetical protein